MVPGQVYDVCFTIFVDDYAHDSCLDAREPVVRVLPGHFGNMVRVLVPDAAASPMEFHDIILEDLVGSLCLVKLPPSGVVGPRLCLHICINSRRTWNTYAGSVGNSMLVSSAVEREVLAPSVDSTLWSMHNR